MKIGFKFDLNILLQIVYKIIIINVIINININPIKKKKKFYMKIRLIISLNIKI